MGFFGGFLGKKFGKSFGLGGSSNVGRRAAEQQKIANAEARKEVERIFGVSEDKFDAQQQQFRDDFLRQRGLIEEGFDPIIEAGGRALTRVEEGGTVGGLDRTIQDILGSGSFQTLRDEQRNDLLFQQTGSGLRRGDALEQFANLSPELAFQLENQLFGRNRDLTRLGFEGAERRGAQGTQLTLGQGQLAGGLTSDQERGRAQFGGRVSDLITGSGRAKSSGILADQQINQQRIQNLINLAGLATGASGAGGGGGGSRISTGQRSF